MRYSRRLTGAAIGAALALLAVGVWGDILRLDADRLPGRDSGNLYSWELYTREVLETGRLPHWNPYHFAGTPHLADPQTTVFYPPAMLLRWLPPVPYLGWMALLHLWLGAVGTLLLARTIGLGWPAAACAALTVLFGGSAGGWLHNGHLLVVYGAAWVPWALAFAVRSARRPTMMPHPGLVIVLVMMFLAGYLQGAIYTAAAVCLYFAFTVAWPPSRQSGAARWRPLAQLSIAAVAAAGLSAFQLLPTLQLVAQAGRAAGVSYDVAIEGAWRPRDLASFFFPLHGVPLEPPHRYLADRTAYVGWLLALVAPFAFFAREHRRTVAFFSTLALVAVAVACAGFLPFYQLHYALFPGLRIPGRVLFVAVVALAILGALGLERFVDLIQRRERVRIAAGVTVMAGLLGAAAVTVLRDAGPGRPSHAWPWLPVVALAGIAVVAVLARRSKRGAALLIALLVVGVDLIAFSADALATVPIEAAHGVQRWMGPSSEGRGISTCENRVGASEMLFNRQPGLDGLAGVHLSDYADWAYIAKFNGVPPRDGLFRRVGSEGTLPARFDLLNVANVTVLYSCALLNVPGASLVSHAGPIYRYRNDLAWPRAFWTCEVQPIDRAAAVARLLGERYTGDGSLRRRVSIKVRWAPYTTDARRHHLENRYGLSDGIREDGSTWQYVLNDTASANVLAMIQDPAVEDTHGLDRARGVALEASPVVAERRSDGPEILVDDGACDAQGVARIAAADRPDGHVAVDVDAPVRGLLFLSEPFYPERQAFVDGEAVGLWKANLAFTAVSVPAGRHHVELRYRRRSFLLGGLVTLLTLVAWGGLLARG